MVKEIVAISHYSVSDDPSELTETKRVHIGYFEPEVSVIDVEKFINERGLNYRVGSTGSKTKVYGYDRFIDSGVVFETFEEMENFIRSGISMDQLLDYATTYGTEKLK